MKHALFSIGFFSFLFASSQNPVVKQWDARFGGSWREELYAFTQSLDGGYLLAGWSYSGISGDKTQANWDTSNIYADFWVVKTDSIGNKEWDKRFGGTQGDFLYAVSTAKDGGYYLGGMSNSGISGDKTQACRGGYDYWIIKIDSAGNKLWDKRFGGSDNDYFFALTPTTDGGFIAGGWSMSNANGDKSEPCRGNEDYWVVKADAFGNKQWDKSYGGINLDELHSVKQTADGGYILGGFSNSGISGDRTEPNWDTIGGTFGFTRDYWVVKTDSLGNKQWDKRYGGTLDDYLYSLQQTTDGGYILGGYTFSPIGADVTQPSQGGSDFWLVKTNASGIKQWDKRFGGNQTEDNVGTVQQTIDAGYLISGTSYSAISGDKSENNLAPEQGWLIKTDSLGNKQWDKTIFDNVEDEVGFAMQTKDGCYAFANFTQAGIGGYKTQASRGDFDYWLIKLCDTTASVKTAISDFKTEHSITVFPNPFTTEIDMLINSNVKQATINLYDVVGNKLQAVQQQTAKCKLETAALSPGFYFLEIIIDGERTVKELVKQ
jgi:hypothetical protein